MGAIVVDSSALIAILVHEDDAQHLLDIMGEADRLLISAAVYAETGIVYDKHPLNISKTDDLAALKHSLDLEVVPVDESLALLARQAYKRFGKGKHPAKLNFGDCFSYALAKQLELPLIFKGNDFSKTDVKIP